MAAKKKATKRRSPRARAAAPASDSSGEEDAVEEARSSGGPPRGGGGGAVRLWLPAACVALAALAVALFVARSRIPLGEARKGEQIVVEGRRIDIGTPVVLWSDDGGYDAYLQRCFFTPDRVLPTAPAPGANTPERIGRRSSKGALADAVSLFVVHYDMAWTSRTCFKVLQDQRGLSVHFMCDMDGTIYQTCDVAERCRHAREANDRSVGVEVAHPGALEEVKGLADRYSLDAGGPRLTLPASFGAQPFRTAGFVPRPARPEPVKGKIHGQVRTMWDYTDAQYHALARLAAGLSRALPRIRLDAPRGADGKVVTGGLMNSGSSVAFEGICGHYHLQTDKFDPGPAFDWERFLDEARRVKEGAAR